MNGLFQLGGYPKAVHYLELLSAGHEYNRSDMRVVFQNALGCFTPVLINDITTRGQNGNKVSGAMGQLIKDVILQKAVKIFEDCPSHSYEAPVDRRTDRFPSWKPIRKRPVYKQDERNYETLRPKVKKSFGDKIREQFIRPEDYNIVIDLEEAELKFDDSWCKNEHSSTNFLSPGLFVVTCGHGRVRGAFSF